MIIGRNAYFKRNNLLIDLKDNIISYSGCNILIMRKGSLRLKQEFIKLDTSPMSNHP